MGWNVMAETIQLNENLGFTEQSMIDNVRFNIKAGQLLANDQRLANSLNENAGKVKVDSTDSTSDYLSGKLIGESDIHITEVVHSGEQKLRIDSDRALDDNIFPGIITIGDPTPVTVENNVVAYASSDFPLAKDSGISAPLIQSFIDTYLNKKRRPEEYIKFSEEKNIGDIPTTFTTNVWTKIQLNKKENDDTSLASISNDNIITLPRGTYRCKFAGQFIKTGANSNTIARLRLFNITDDKTAAYGMSGYSQNAASNFDSTEVYLDGSFSVGKETQFRVDIFVKAAATLGEAQSLLVDTVSIPEIYFNAEFMRMSSEVLPGYGLEEVFWDVDESINKVYRYWTVTGPGLWEDLGLTDDSLFRVFKTSHPGWGTHGTYIATAVTYMQLTPYKDYSSYNFDFTFKRKNVTNDSTLTAYNTFNKNNTVWSETYTHTDSLVGNPIFARPLAFGYVPYTQVSIGYDNPALYATVPPIVYNPTYDTPGSGYLIKMPITIYLSTIGNYHSNLFVISNKLRVFKDRG